VKKFKKPFDSYKLSSRYRPMSIELHWQGLKAFRDLAENPLYYLNAIQYTNGELYRAIFGYEFLWDREYEGEIMLALDYYLTELDKRGHYYLEEVKVDRPFTLEGRKWRDGLKPKPLTFQKTALAKDRIPSGLRATARVNTMDVPSHVDIEFDNGAIYSVNYIKYQNWKERKLIRSLTHENKPRSASDGSGEAGPAARTRFPLSEAVPLPANVHRLQRRLTGQNALRKLRTKI
jgi:hypothetical protein